MAGTPTNDEQAKLHFSGLGTPSATKDNDERNDGPSNPKTCYLTTIPPELRNNIYELAFTTAADIGDEIQFITAEPPTPSLLLACRQICAEAKPFYETAYRRFWTTGQFVVHCLSESISMKSVQRFRDADLFKINNIKVVRSALHTDYLNHMQVLVRGRATNWLIHFHTAAVRDGSRPMFLVNPEEADFHLSMPTENLLDLALNGDVVPLMREELEWAVSF